MQAAEEASAPEGVSPEAWKDKKQGQLVEARNELQRVAYDLYVGASEVQQPARQEALLRQFVQVFPQSDYLSSAYFVLAVAAQQQGDLQGAIRWGERGLQVDPNQGGLMVLVADLLSDRGLQLTRARDLANRLLQTLRSDPARIRPPGYSDQQWAQQRRVWRGLGHSILGQVYLHWGATDPPDRARLRKAIEEFQAGSPLLKSDKVSYARNLFRTGFAYAKLGEYDEAREVLNEAIALGTAYTQPARDLLSRLR